MISTLAEVKGIGPKTEEKLNKLDIFTPADLLNYLPKSYIDLDAVCDLDNALDGDIVILILEITTSYKPTKKNSLDIFRATGQTKDGKKVILVWYNRSYVARFVFKGRSLRFYGKIKIEGKKHTLTNPTYENLNEESALRGIKPIYTTKGVVAQGTFHSFMENALLNYEFVSIIPKQKEIEHNILSLTESYKIVHCPTDLDRIKVAKERIFLEETLKRTAAYKLIKDNEFRTQFYEDNKNEVEYLISTLPYKLTPSQRDAVDWIMSEFLSEKPVNALVTGDVGSGKTIVSLIATFFAALSKKQSAVIAPTSILAFQHYTNFKRILAPFGIDIALLLGSTPLSEKREIKRRLAEGRVDIVIGTHAIFTKDVAFKSLSLAIVDEQHRFGVSQRTSIYDKGKAIDMLTLSATPIPRSLRLSVLKNLDVVSIERRHDNSNIITKIVKSDKRKAALDYIASECQKGTQAYVVAPLIYDVEGIERFAAEGLFKEITALYSDKIKIGFLHGKLKPEQKEDVLTRFSQGEISILVSTTVIEIGIDVPNASLMMIFDADSFGLATLHQLRGRIGRNGQKSYCFLYTSAENEEEVYRLKVLSEERDGIKIAEKDYEIRGAGDYLGQNQSGTSIFRPSLKTVMLARDLSDCIDYEKHGNMLTEYAKALNLQNVVLN